MAVESTKPLPKIIFENLSNNEDIIKNGAVLVEETSSSPEALVEKNILDKNNIPTILSAQEKTRYKNIGFEFNASVIDNFNKRLIAEKNEQEMLIEDDKDTILGALKDSVKERLKNKIKNSGQNNNNELMGKLLLAGLAIGSIGAFIKEKVEKWWGNIRGFFDNFFNEGLNKIKEFFGKPFDDLKNLGTEMKDKITGVVTKLGTEIEKVFVGENGILTSISEGITTAFTTVKKAIEALGDVDEGNFDSMSPDDMVDSLGTLTKLQPDEAQHERNMQAIDTARKQDGGYVYDKDGNFISSKEALEKLASKKVTIDKEALNIVAEHLALRLSKKNSEALTADGTNLNSNMYDAAYIAGGVANLLPIIDDIGKLSPDEFKDKKFERTMGIDYIDRLQSNYYITEWAQKAENNAKLFEAFIEAEQISVGNGFNAIKEKLTEIAPSADEKQITHLAGILNIEYKNTSFGKQVESKHTAKTLIDKPKTIAEMQYDEETGIRTN